MPSSSGSSCPRKVTEYTFNERENVFLKELWKYYAIALKAVPLTVSDWRRGLRI
jgi:hypothetical protein